MAWFFFYYNSGPRCKYIVYINSKLSFYFSRLSWNNALHMWPDLQNSGSVLENDILTPPLQKENNDYFYSYFFCLNTYLQIVKDND